MALGPIDTQDMVVEKIAKQLEFEFDISISTCIIRNVTISGVDGFKVATTTYIHKDLFDDVAVKIKTAYENAGWTHVEIYQKDGYISTLVLERSK
jgi:hypothetical protein